MGIKPGKNNEIPCSRLFDGKIWGVQSGNAGPTIETKHYFSVGTIWNINVVRYNEHRVVVHVWEMIATILRSHHEIGELIVVLNEAVWVAR